MNIYVGNLSGDVSGEDLRQAFEAFGQVASATVIMDKFSGKSRGFGFVEMSSRDEAQSAIDGLNGKDLKGQRLSVNEARPRTEKHGGKREQRGDKGGFDGKKGKYGGGRGKYSGSRGGRGGDR